MKKGQRARTVFNPTVAVTLLVLVGLTAPSLSAAPQAQVGGKPVGQGGQGAQQKLFEKLPNTLGRDLLPWEETYRVHKSVVTFVGERRVKVGAFGGPTMNVIGEEGEFLIIRMAPPEDPSSPYHKAWLYHSVREIQLQMQADLLATRYFIADRPPVSLPFIGRLQPQSWSEGLPTAGEWQLSGDVADFNGDGVLDLVLPPPRGGKPNPTIYINLGGGKWGAWGEQQYPKDLPFDYGSVRAADFNGDGNLDLALACHFKGFYVIYGDGHGKFLRWEQLPTAVGGVTSKTLTVADFNGDGRLDIASVAEIDLSLALSQRFSKGLGIVILNTREGWRAVEGGFPERFMGDDVAAADLDRDGFSDLIFGSLSQGQDRIFFLNRDQGRRWEAFGLDQVPYNSFVSSVAVGPLRRGAKDQVAVLCFEQVNPLVAEDPTVGCALYRFWEGGKFLHKPKVELLFSEKESFRRLQAATFGDVNGDGLSDLIVGDSNGQVSVLLQLRGERFFENRPAVTVGGKVVSLRAVDLNGDGKDEVVVMGVPTVPGLGGGVWVFSFAPLEAGQRG
ncbi:MAG: VCBS repeat-containing protein [Thermoanaerobaculum sp.]|nr:VCBS repeat-containing protein [Thermoanaerobaculum sp.]MDW7966813.1 VCBS repeat-containing protein [Thermoanaerobaculum sp.]